MVEKAGGRTVDVISGVVDFVVVSEGSGQKKQEAVKLGIELLDEEEFLAGLQGGFSAAQQDEKPTADSALDAADDLEDKVFEN